MFRIAPLEESRPLLALAERGGRLGAGDVDGPGPAEGKLLTLNAPLRFQGLADHI